MSGWDAGGVRLCARGDGGGTLHLQSHASSGHLAAAERPVPPPESVPVSRGCGGRGEVHSAAEVNTESDQGASLPLRHPLPRQQLQNIQERCRIRSVGGEEQQQQQHHHHTNNILHLILVPAAVYQDRSMHQQLQDRISSTHLQNRSGFQSQQFPLQTRIHALAVHAAPAPGLLLDHRKLFRRNNHQQDHQYHSNDFILLMLFEASDHCL